MNKNDRQHALVPQLRFPEFRDSEGWANVTIADAVKTVTPPKKLKTSQYDEAGRYPVIDQSADAICGWTDDEEAVIRKPLPMIVFGDHTCVIKKANAPFAQGADGIKILIGRNGFDTDFLYQLLCARPLKCESYNRHFTKLKLVEVPRPPSPGEQQKIADCLGSLDDLLAAEGRKLAALRDHKKGLMQQLFPREGESRPRVRFPEYQNSGDWKAKPLSAALDYQQPGPFIVSSENYGASGTPVLTAGKTFILGYTDETDGVFDRLPVIIFDDFTTASQFVDFPFKVKSSAMKILSPREGYSLKFTFEDMSLIEFDASQHKRYWIGEFQHIEMPFPDEDEQGRIADCLSAVDALIFAQAEKLDALAAHKRGLMQQLFPSPEGGKT